MATHEQQTKVHCTFSICSFNPQENIRINQIRTRYSKLSLSIRCLLSYDSRQRLTASGWLVVYYLVYDHHLLGLNQAKRQYKGQKARNQDQS